MSFLQMRMNLLLAVMFAIVYAVVVMIGTAMGMENFYFYLIISLGIMFFQFMIGPKIVEWSMHVRYVKREENPELYAIVEDQARKAEIPMPRVGVSELGIPNAFAFGRGLSDGRVCVTTGIMRLLNPAELKAVIGHEISHLKNRDVVTITILSVIPMVLYRLAWHFLFYSNRRRNDQGANTAVIGMVAFIFYFITNLLVLYASRIREYFADQGSVKLGNPPSALASALYKLVYGCARVGREPLHEAEGLKAFFVNDPSKALTEIRQLAQIDVDKSGTIDPNELAMLRSKNIDLSFFERAMEVLGTHPNMLKRIKFLSEQQQY